MTTLSIINLVTDCYEVLTVERCSKRHDWGVIDRHTIPQQDFHCKAKERVKRDAKCSKKSLKKFERRNALPIPIVIVGEILQFAAVFNKKKLNALNPEHLGRRVCSLYAPTYGEMIDANRLLKFIDAASHAYSWWRGAEISWQTGRILNHMFETDGSLDWLRQMVKRPNTEHLTWLMLWRMAGIRNGMKRLIDADFYDLLVNRRMKTMFLVTSKREKDLEAFKVVTSGIINSNLELDVLRNMLRRGLFDSYCDGWIRYIRSDGFVGCISPYAVPITAALDAIRRMLNAESSLDIELLIERLSRFPNSESLIARLRTI